MPSFFSKLTGSSKKSNPYLNSHHPSHAPLPKQPTRPSQTLRPASPRGSHDYLAEARELANRDPVTGRPLPQPNMPQQGSQARAPQQSSPGAEASAYQHRAKQTKKTTGSRYDLFSGQERERMEREEKIRIARGGTEYYAPERRVEEFYSEPVRY